MQWKDESNLACIPDAIIEPFTRVKINAVGVVGSNAPGCTTAGVEEHDGVMWNKDPYGQTSPACQPQTVRLRTHPGTVPMIASAAIAALATVYPAASGKITSTVQGLPIGIALWAASGDGSIVEVFPFPVTRQKFSLFRPVLAADVDNYIWICDRKCTLVAAGGINDVACASGVLNLRKITAAGTARAGAAAGATVIEQLTVGLDLSTAAGTAIVGSLSAVAGARDFEIGDKLAMDLSGTLTNLVGALSVDFQTR